MFTQPQQRSYRGAPYQRGVGVWVGCCLFTRPRVNERRSVLSNGCLAENGDRSLSVSDWSMSRVSADNGGDKPRHTLGAAGDRPQLLSACLTVSAGFQCWHYATVRSHFVSRESGMLAWFPFPTAPRCVPVQRATIRL